MTMYISLFTDMILLTLSLDTIINGQWVHTSLSNLLRGILYLTEG